MSRFLWTYYKFIDALVYHLALVVYEYVITLHEEVDSIRHRGFGNTSLFFVFTRYTMLLGPFAQFMSQYLQVS